MLRLLNLLASVTTMISRAARSIARFAMVSSRLVPLTPKSGSHPAPAKKSLSAKNCSSISSVARPTIDAESLRTVPPMMIVCIMCDPVSSKAIFRPLVITWTWGMFLSCRAISSVVVPESKMIVSPS